MLRRSLALMSLVSLCATGCQGQPPRVMKVDRGVLSPLAYSEQDPSDAPLNVANTLPYVPPRGPEADSPSQYLTFSVRAQGQNKNRDLAAWFSNIFGNEVGRIDLELRFESGIAGGTPPPSETVRLVVLLNSEAALATVVGEEQKAALTKMEGGGDTAASFNLPRVAPHAVGRMFTVRGTFKLLSTQERKVATQLLAAGVNGSASGLPGFMAEGLKKVVAATEPLPNEGVPFGFALMDDTTCKDNPTTCQGTLKSQSILIAERSGALSDGEFAKVFRRRADGSLYDRRKREVFDDFLMTVDITVARLPDELFDGLCRQRLSVGRGWRVPESGSLTEQCASTRLTPADRSRVLSLLAPIERLLDEKSDLEKRAQALAELNAQLKRHCGGGAGLLPDSSAFCQESRKLTRTLSEAEPSLKELAGAWGLLKSGLSTLENLTPESTTQYCRAYGDYREKELRSVRAFLAAEGVKEHNCLVEEDRVPMMTCKALPLAAETLNASRLRRQKFAELCRWEGFLEATRERPGAAPAFEIAVRGTRELGPNGEPSQLKLPPSVDLLIGQEVPDARLEEVAAEVCRLSDPKGVLPVSEQWRGIQGHLAKQLREYRDRQNRSLDSVNAFAERHRERLRHQSKRLRGWMQRATSDKDKAYALKLVGQMEEELAGLTFNRLGTVDAPKGSWLPSGNWMQIDQRIDTLLQHGERLLSSPPATVPAPCASTSEGGVCDDSV